MMQRTKPFFFLNVVIVWFLLCIFIVFGSYYLYVTDIEQTIRKIKAEEVSQLKLEKNLTEYILGSVLDDLQILARQNELQDVDNNIDLIAKEYQAVVEEKKVYAQIRFIDNKGAELIRVDLKDDSSEIIRNESLQNKSDRYYFKETLKLKPGQIHISSFDLNVENRTVEMPFKPMIRFSIPIYKEQKELSGMVIINYLGQDFIDSVINVDSLTVGTTYLLNDSGYWLYSNVPENDWAFMFPGKKDVSFKQSCPKLWDKISKLQNGEVELGDKWASFVTIDPLGYRYNKCMSSSYKQTHQCHYISETSRRSWKLVSMITRKNISEIKRNMLCEYLVIVCLLFVFMLLPSILIALNRVKQRKYRFQLWHMANHDKLTDLPNRGLFNDRLSQALSMSDRTGKKVGLLYIDLDGFKPINDTIGHNAGDVVLKITARRLEECIRASDTAARLGGDEFAILLPELDGIDYSKMIAQRIIDSIAEPMDIENQSCSVGASIGIAHYLENASNLEDLIKCADKAMYQSKASGKNCFTVFQ